MDTLTKLSNAANRLASQAAISALMKLPAVDGLSALIAVISAKGIMAPGNGNAGEDLAHELTGLLNAAADFDHACKP